MAGFDFYITALTFCSKFHKSVSPYIVMKSTGTHFKVNLSFDAYEDVTLKK